MVDPAAQLRRQSSGPIAAITRGASTRQRATLVLPPTSARGVPMSGANADASQYFSIETRLELKTRLTKLQLQLRQLLVQAKLAWMRCFAEPTTASARAAAVQMVHLGETLTTGLSRGFDLAAGTATAPLSEYQALVSRVEAEMAAFQQLVTNAANGSFPPLEGDESCADEDESSEDDGEEEEEQGTTYLNRPVHLDLPSMQTYCNHVAPPYSSYLPNNATRTAAKKRLG